QERFTEQTGWELALLLGKSAEVKGTYWSASAGSTKRKEQNEAIAIARKTLAGVDGLYKVGVDGGTGTLLLRFYFPDAVQSRITEQLQTIEEKTGWGVRIYPTVHQEELAATVRRLLPEGLYINGSPSIHHDRRTVALNCTGTAGGEAIEEAQKQFNEVTGWQLEINVPHVPRSEGPGSATNVTRGEGFSSAVKERSLSQDDVLAIVYDVFGETDDLYRVGTDVAKELIVLRFYFPDVAQVQYIEEILELEARTGWQVQVHPGTNQDSLQSEVRSLVPLGIELVGALSLYHHERRMVVTYQGLWDERARKVAQMAFQEKTGWELELRSSG
ncbi:MAG TPA: hypothetical protein VIY29_05850, partial [Ktedonobacteraceae bacterium]